MKKLILALFVLSSAATLSSCTAVATTEAGTETTYVGLGYPGYITGGYYPGYYNYRAPIIGGIYRSYTPRYYYGPRFYRPAWYRW
ncbi:MULTISPECIES: hypothetical protein [Legionella]|uniref:hypothetical protein n=1 Tax=Legionella TaxID=445 RepID=UPI000F8C74C0|nr:MULTISPECIES: hypothetical protein [Legionella]MCP0913782.1 hypothetical protein [Legionella sp. 27cVA30]RUR09683.1 hypothetical protein ELY14_07730 [Legionella septentrionalis]RUR14519.1 hypothetical protein ELY10_08355 [Legionella septentrionalis]